MIKVACCGTFDLFHDGHKHLLNSVCFYGDEIHIFVIGNSIVKSNKNRDSKHSLSERISNVKSFLPSAIVHAMDLEPSLNMQMVLDLNPNVYCFGQDQNNLWNQELKQCLLIQGCHCVTIPRLPGISTTELILNNSQFRNL